MTPYYTLAIDVTIKGAKDSEDITLRCVKMVPFIPATGQVLELWHDDSEGEEETYRVELVNVYYSMQHSMFIEEQEDHDLDALVRGGAGTAIHLKELLQWYGRFGFTRVSYPSVNIK